MKILKLLLSLIKMILPTAATFAVGRKSKELDQLKDENEKLKKYRKINELKITKDELKNMENWK